MAASRSAGISIEKTMLYEVTGSPRDGWLPFEIAMPLQSAEGQGGQLLDLEHLLASSWRQAQRNSVEFLKVPDAWSSENDPAPGGCPADGEEARTGPTHPLGAGFTAEQRPGWLESKLSSCGRFNLESVTLGPHPLGWEVPMKAQICWTLQCALCPGCLNGSGGRRRPQLCGCLQNRKLLF